MAQNNGDFTEKMCRMMRKYVFLKGNSALPTAQSRTRLLGSALAEHLNNADDEPSGRLTQVTIPENVDSIRCSTTIQEYLLKR
jgi:hypothetical protein